MSFVVRPAALRALSADLGEQAEAARTARGYVDQHGSFGVHDSGLIGILAQAHSTFVGALRQRLTRTEELLAASATEIARAADQYERGDQASAATIDATLPPADPSMYRSG
jgi:hypothetical protein